MSTTLRATHYDTLGIWTNDTTASIRQAYKELKAKPEIASKAFKTEQLNKAFSILNDASARKEYDLEQSPKILETLKLQLETIQTNFRSISTMLTNQVVDLNKTINTTQTVPEDGFQPQLNAAKHARSNLRDSVRAFEDVSAGILEHEECLRRIRAANLMEWNDFLTTRNVLSEQRKYLESVSRDAWVMVDKLEREVIEAVDSYAHRTY